MLLRGYVPDFCFFNDLHLLYMFSPLWCDFSAWVKRGECSSLVRVSGI